MTYNDLNPEERFIIDTYRSLQDTNKRLHLYNCAMNLLQPKPKGKPIHFPAQPR